MGPNGSGKTCLLEVLAGYLTISNGNAYVGNKCLTQGFEMVTRLIDPLISSEV